MAASPLAPSSAALRLFWTNKVHLGWFGKKEKKGGWQQCEDRIWTFGTKLCGGEGQKMWDLGKNGLWSMDGCLSCWPPFSHLSLNSGQFGQFRAQIILVIGRVKDF
jgi:hypothetical protein